MCQQDPFEQVLRNDRVDVYFCGDVAGIQCKCDHMMSSMDSTKWQKYRAVLASIFQDLLLI